MIAFERHLNSLVVSGDPLCEPGIDGVEVLDRFVDWAHRRRLAVCGYYFSQHLADHHRFEFTRAGVSRLVNLKDFVLSGHRPRDIRRALNQGRRAQLEFSEMPYSERGICIDEILSLEKAWLKTRRGPRIGFLLSSPQLEFCEQERWFCVRGPGGELQAFASVIQYSENGEYYLDQMIQGPTAHRFALDFLLSRLILRLKQEGQQRLSLGFCAFRRLEDQGLMSRLLQAGGQMEFLYNSKGLYSYKRKFTNEEEPRYMMIDPSRNRWLQLAALARATYAS